MPGRRTADPNRRLADGETTVEPTVTVDLPLTGTVSHDRDDRVSHCGHFDFHLLARHGGEVVAGQQTGEHEVGVGVFMIDAQQAALKAASISGQWQERDIVAVVAKLPCLSGSRLSRDVKRRTIGEQRIAPADQHIPLIPVSDASRLIHPALQFSKLQRMVSLRDTGFDRAWVTG